VKDSAQTKYSDNRSIWGVRLGFFPIYGDNLKSAGISESLFSESKISKFFNLGWTFQVNETIDGKGGYLSLSGFLSYPIKIEDNTILIKSGLGLATYTYPTPTALFEIEYLIFEFEKTAISLSLSESIIGFNKIMPPVISIGILF
jgi:hypothetical protein